MIRCLKIPLLSTSLVYHKRFDPNNQFRYITPALLQNQTMMNTTSGSANIDCNNLMQNLSIPCWDELDVSGYLAQWWKQNQGYCESIGFGFATCYQSSIGMQQQACDITGPNQCTFPDNFAAGGYSHLEAYALYAIFGIWQWFESIYEAVGNADVTVSPANLLSVLPTQC